jgi:hypothetical protein
MHVRRWDLHPDGTDSGGRPQGWWVTGSPCGHNHGVLPTQASVVMSIRLCLTAQIQLIRGVAVAMLTNLLEARMDTPDFNELGESTMWSAVEWSDAWLESFDLMPVDQQERADMWTGVVAFGRCGFRPTRVVGALKQALFS